VERIRVSYKPDHGVEGRLHNDTAYGLVEHNPKGPSVVVHRVPVTTFGKTEDLKAIRDTELREELHDRLGSLQGKEFQAALARWSEETGVRRVRVMESLEIIPIRDREGHAYKAYKGDSNYAIEIWRDDKGRWRGDVITTFEANQMARKGLIPLPKDVAGNGKPLVMRLCKDDTVLVEEGGRKRIMRVVKFSQSGQIALAELHESGNLKERDADKTDEFKYLLKNPGGLLPLKARRVTIDFLGILHDPGFTP
jgi:CRISPR-associated endonuclease Csn1